MSIAVKPETYRFNIRKNSDAEAGFVRLISRHEADTEYMQITELPDMLLDHNGLVQGRFRLTTNAMTQLCRKLSRGLTQALLDISGDIQLPPSEAKTLRSCDEGLAVRWLNDVIKLRFNLLCKRVLVVDHRKKRIEGLVGSNYSSLSNWSLYEKINKLFTNESRGKVTFCEATISGRRMSVHFRGGKLFTIPTTTKPEPFYGGYQFSNSEVGDLAVRASAVVIRQWCNNKAVSPSCGAGTSREGRLTHHKITDFDKRLRALFAQVIKRGKESAGFQDNFAQLIQRKLGLGVDKLLHAERVKWLERRLVRYKVPGCLAAKAVRRAAYYGSYRDQAMQRADLPMDVFASRTAYDLFNALTHEAKKYPVIGRASAEQLGYRMLLGEFNWS